MATDWTAPIDAYCERIDASFWSEPVNALSNAAFLVAAAIAFARWRRAGASDLPALFLIAAVAVVGIGSFLFHTFANRWSRLADVIPIAVFIYGYFALAMRRFFGLGACGERRPDACVPRFQLRVRAGVAPRLRAARDRGDERLGRLFSSRTRAVCGRRGADRPRPWPRSRRPPAARRTGAARRGVRLRRVARLPHRRHRVLRRLAARDALRLAHAQRGGPLHSRRGGHALSGSRRPEPQ